MSRILFPDSLDANPNPSTSHLDRVNSSNNIHSFKAPYRPGKIPSESLDSRPFLKRSQSIISLPSPPSERKLRKPTFGGRGGQSSDGETTDASDADGDGDGDVTMGGASAGEEGLRPAPVLRAGLLRPVNARNPFLDVFEDASKSNDRPDHPQQSPTQQARRIRRKVDIERIQLGGVAGRAQEEELVEEEEEKQETKPMKDGWDDPNNPFLEKNDVKRASSGEVRKGKKPDQMVYVFRGKRITYDVPFESLIAADPTDSPFPDPSPKLLFPAAPNSTRTHDPTTPPSKLAPTPSFLDALRKSNEQGLASPEKSPVKKKGKAGSGEWGTSNLGRGEKRVRDDSFGEGLGGAKKWRGGGEEVEMEV